MSRIRILDYNTEIGVVVDTAVTFHLKSDVTISSDGNAVISIFDKGELIISANTEDFDTPIEASVKDLVFLIKNILTLPVDTPVELEELITLKEVHEDLLINNDYLNETRKNTAELNNIKELIKITNKLLKKIYNPD